MPRVRNPADVRFVVNWPDRTKPAQALLSAETWTVPASSACRFSEAPLKGTWSHSTPLLAAISSMVNCRDVPCPGEP